MTIMKKKTGKGTISKLYKAARIFSRTDMKDQPIGYSYTADSFLDIGTYPTGPSVIVLNDTLDGATRMDDFLGSTTYTYDNEYRYGDIYGKLSVKNSLIDSNVQQSSFGYDDEGHLNTGYGSTYQFDYEHRLKTIDTTAYQYFYDGKGNRLKAIRNGVTTYYVYDMNGNVLAEANGTKTITRLYIQGQGLLAAVTPTNNQVYTYHFNPIGTTAAITDQGQNIVNKYAYDSFGSV